MINTKLVAITLVFSMLAGVPVSALANSDAAQGTPTKRGPAIARAPRVVQAAAPLTAAELRTYDQLQAAAQQTGLLVDQKGGTDATTWTIVGIAVVVAVGLGMFFAIKDAPD
jgi:hypothetical protein